MRRSAVLLLAVLFAGFLLLRPRFLGGRVSYFLVWDEAMQPALHQGDLAAFLERDVYEAGEIVALASGFSTSLGQIEALTPDGYLVRAVDEEDALRTVPGEKILGRLWFRIGGSPPS